MTTTRQHVVRPGDHNKITAGLFALLLGGIGVHKFYLGQVGQGILCILFCWTGIPSIIALIDGIVFLSMSDENFDARFNSATE
jgi:TM2 domain-containing membrane protein YozV